MPLKIKSATHSDELVTGVAKLLSDTTGIHSDVQLEVGGKIFHCHTLILAMKSPYFEQKLHPSSSSSSPSAAAAADNQQIVLNDVSADTFDKVLQFMYTGETELSDENVELILKAANLMKLTELTQLCVDYLTDRISFDTCLCYWSDAEQMSLDTLALACKRFCVKEFEKLGSSSLLSSLTEKMMRELLEEDELVVESEVDVCETLIKWLNSQIQNINLVDPYEFLTLIRWSGIPVEYVNSRLMTDDILTAYWQSFEYLSKVISYQLTVVQFGGLNTFHRSSTGVEQCVVIVGMGDRFNKHSEVFRVSLQHSDNDTTMSVIPAGVQCDIPAAESHNQMYVSGAGVDKIQTWKWELASGWTRCEDMIEGRRSHCATFVNNTSMYVVGGFVSKGYMILDSIEQYNTVTNKWTNVGQLIHAAHTAACVVYKTSIYVFGGCGQNGVILDSVQVFDTATKVCTELTERLPQPDWMLRAVMWDKSVILINCDTCLIFDLEQQTFQQRNQFAAGVEHFGLVLENQRIFIIGGGHFETEGDEVTTWTCSDEVKSVAVMDIINNQTISNWIRHAKLPTPSLIRTYASVTLPS